MTHGNGVRVRTSATAPYQLSDMFGAAVFRLVHPAVPVVCVPVSGLRDSSSIRCHETASRQLRPTHLHRSAGPTRAPPCLRGVPGQYMPRGASAEVARLTQLQPGYCALVGTDTSGSYWLICACGRRACARGAGGGGRPAASLRTYAGGAGVRYAVAHEYVLRYSATSWPYTRDGLLDSEEPGL